MLVLHSWWGLTYSFRATCDRLAKEGFVALAPDLYRGRTASTIEEAKALRSSMGSGRTEKAIIAAIQQLRSYSDGSGTGVGVIGFSMGARWALWLATKRPVDVSAVTMFYGTRTGDYARSRAAFLGHFASDDPWVSQKSLRQLEKQLRSSGKEAILYVYPGTRHWFFEQEQRDAYDPRASQLAWKRTVQFLRKQLA